MAEINAGNDYEITTIAYTSGVAVIVSTTRPVKSFILKELSGSNAWRLYRADGDTVYFPLLPGESFSMNVERGRRTNVVSTRTYTIGYVQTESGGAGTFICLVTY